MLGVHLTPNRSNKLQLNKMKEKIKKWLNMFKQDICNLTKHGRL